jgi:hypothetical protein
MKINTDYFGLLVENIKKYGLFFYVRVLRFRVIITIEERRKKNEPNNS